MSFVCSCGADVWTVDGIRSFGDRTCVVCDECGKRWTTTIHRDAFS